MFCAGGTEAEKNGGRRCVGGVSGETRWGVVVVAVVNFRWQMFLKGLVEN